MRLSLVTTYMTVAAILAFSFLESHCQAANALKTSDESIELIQPEKSILEGILFFRVQIRYETTGGIGDIEREVRLEVQPREPPAASEAKIYTMNLFDRTIFDLPDHSVFVDKYESKVDTTTFEDGWYIIDILYLENAKQVDSITADFYFNNSGGPPPETTTTHLPTKSTTTETPAASQALTQTITALLVIAIAALAVYLLSRIRRGRV